MRDQQTPAPSFSMPYSYRPPKIHVDGHNCKKYKRRDRLISEEEGKAWGRIERLAKGLVKQHDENDMTKTNVTLQLTAD